MAPGKADEQVLFPEAEVEGYTIRPWTLAQSVALAPTLGALVEIARGAGLGDLAMDRGDKRRLGVSAVLGVIGVSHAEDAARIL